MLREETILRQRDERLARARALRDEYARAAALCAYRIERVREGPRRAELGELTLEYRRSVARCRLLGQVIRGEREAA
jgi:hypothetical protein